MVEPLLYTPRNTRKVGEAIVAIFFLNMISLLSKTRFSTKEKRGRGHTHLQRKKREKKKQIVLCFFFYLLLLAFFSVSLYITALATTVHCSHTQLLLRQLYQWTLRKLLYVLYVMRLTLSQASTPVALAVTAAAHAAAFAAITSLNQQRSLLSLCHQSC